MSLTLHTSLGDLVVELECDKAPRACLNFIALAASGYYIGTRFHRSVPRFLVQGGDPTGTGKKGESAYGTAFENEVCDDLRHDRRGILGMANRGPNTNQSQFYITYARQNQLDGTSTVFGRIVDGMDTLHAMEQVDVDQKYRPLKPITIDRITIHANPMTESSFVQELKRQ